MTPDEIINDLESGSTRSAKHVAAVMWALIEDIQDSYLLAMEGLKVPRVAQLEIHETVEDYLSNAYGDS